MATKYLHKFASTSAFIAFAPDRSLGSGLGVVSDVIYHNVGGVAYRVADESPTSTFIKAKTDTAAAPAAAFNLIEGNLTFTNAAISVASASHEAGVRGSVTVGSGGTLVEGFLYGTQGRAIVDTGGIMNEGSAARMAGIFGRLQINGEWVDGQGSAVWADVSGAGTYTGVAEINALRVTNSAGTNINSLAYFNGKANALFDISEASPSFIATAGTGAQSAGVATGGVAAQVLKVVVGGATRYIPLFSSNA